MKITRTTPYSISVEKNGLKTKALGESFVSGHGSPDFIIDSRSIEKWESEDKTAVIDDYERASIVEFILDELRARGWKIESE
ncbi:hypothetical protein J5J83_01920 [Azoarcus sp. L1K30]|uniref:Imm74 family immunity protein n=1 Tax=Azoarcus sp. L1K30 TaxID=2820277 RepID=UPI001B824317|nr:Imm74 family immunity protein [Azoarcus sp. L1K30]MBR0564870.1 hypothetical protein [Azoarcus sp. L1K30]